MFVSYSPNINPETLFLILEQLYYWVTYYIANSKVLECVALTL